MSNLTVLGKLCRRCGLVKPLIAFSGRWNPCGECQSKASLASYYKRMQKPGQALLLRLRGRAKYGRKINRPLTLEERYSCVLSVKSSALKSWARLDEECA